MPSLETYECESSGTEFKAVGDASAADGPYCSASCGAEGKGLA